MAECGQGVFSFSDQSFQEYFTARKIVVSHNLQASDQALEQLVSHITDPRWREIFLLTVAMLRNADSLVRLMKQQIDAIVADDPTLREHLAWVSQHNQPQEWYFSPEQQARLQQYYIANQCCSIASIATVP